MDGEVEVSAMAINVTVPEHLQWTDERRGEEFLLTTLNVRMLPDGALAAKAYGRPTAGGRGRTRPSASPTPPSCAPSSTLQPLTPRGDGPATAASPDDADAGPPGSVVAR
ncbi:hypothetical protein [Phycicoccus sp. HDW14]|uniref:hypothetical protein n=1 Tax=Phycicoccus sp. HDW14 TaxID=2714941 RepID=UPI001F0DDE11|nr:hypothetical protein [Phycicoccus sp. HDW14]